MGSFIVYGLYCGTDGLILFGYPLRRLREAFGKGYWDDAKGEDQVSVEYVDVLVDK